MGCHSQRSPWSTCGSSSVADGLEDLGDEFIYPASLNRQNLSEIQAGASNESDEETEKLREERDMHDGLKHAAEFA